MSTINYTIKSGDNLSKIAKQLGTTVQELQRQNNISNPNFIVAGKTIKYSPPREGTWGFTDKELKELILKIITKCQIDITTKNLLGARFN